MINDKTFDLINRELDGTLSKGEKEQLEKHLKSDKEAAELLAKMRLLHKKISSIEAVEPPADLKQSVMGKLAVVRHSSAYQHSPLKSKIIELFALPRFQMAGMFSLGMAATLLLFVVSHNMSSPSGASPEKSIGALIAPEKGAEATSIDSKQINIDDYKVEISTSRAGSTVFAKINFKGKSNQVIQLMVSSAGTESFRFNALEYRAPNLIYSNFGNDFFSAATAGPGSWVLAFEDPNGTAQSLKIELKTEGSFSSEVIAVQKHGTSAGGDETSSN